MANQNSGAMPEWIPRLIITVILSILAAAATLLLVFRLSALISWLLVAMFLSFALEPLVNKLVQLGWRRRVATIGILAVFVFGAMLVVVAMVPLLIRQVGEIFDQAPGWLESLVSWVNTSFHTRISQSAILDQLKSLDQVLPTYASNLAGNIFNFSRQLFLGVLQVLTITLFTYYLVADAPRLRRIICSFLPQKHQKFVLSTWELAIDKTGGYIYSRLIIGAISAAVHLVVFLILGIPFALPLAIWMGAVSQLLPVIGTFIAAGVPLVVALLYSPPIALLLLIFIVIYQQIENYAIGPKVSAETMELHPAVAFAAVVAGASLAGIVGAFLALPIAAILQESLRIYLKRHEVVESRLLMAPRRKPRNTKAA